jgi:hypothetical protein
MKKNLNHLIRIFLAKLNYIFFVQFIISQRHHNYNDESLYLAKKKSLKCHCEEISDRIIKIKNKKNAVGQILDNSLRSDLVYNS